jgi:hypothetical protein
MQILHVNRFQTNPFDLAKAQHACSHHANNMPSVLRCDRTLLQTTDHRIARTIEEQVKLLHHQQDNTTTMIAKAYLNLLRTHGHPVHLQEGSSYFFQQSVHPTALSKVPTSLAHIYKPKSLVATLSDFHLSMHITFLNMPNTLETQPF